MYNSTHLIIWTGKILDLQEVVGIKYYSKKFSEGGYVENPLFKRHFRSTRSILLRGRYIFDPFDPLVTCHPFY